MLGMKRKQSQKTGNVAQKRARRDALLESKLATCALSLPPVLARLLYHLPLSECIRIRRVSCAFKDAVDTQLRTLKQLDLGRVSKPRKLLMVLEWMTEKAPGIQRLIFPHFGGLRPSADEIRRMGVLVEKFRNLKALDLSQLYKYRSNGDSAAEQALILLNAVANRIQSLSFVFPLGRARDRLIGVFQQLHQLQHLVIDYRSGYYLSTVLERLPKPELLKQLVVSSLTWNCITFLTKFKALEDVKVGCLYSFHEKDFPSGVTQQLQSLKSLRFDSIHGYHCQELMHSMSMVSMLPNLEEFVTDLAKYPDTPLPWHQFSCLKHLVLKDVTQQHLEGINILSSLTTVELKLRKTLSHQLNFELPQLQLLLVSGGSSITFQLQPCPVLTTVALSSSPSSIHSVIPGLLAPNPQIQHLILGWDLSTSKSYFQLMKTISINCPNLYTLELQGRKVQEEGINAVLHKSVDLFVECCPKLKYLKVFWNGRERGQELEKIGEQFPQLSINFMDRNFVGSTEPLFPCHNLSNFDVSRVCLWGNNERISEKKGPVCL